MERENYIYRSNALFNSFHSDLFTIGGVTGVMLAMSAADYQYHNTMFLVAHFHNVIIPGVVFADACWSHLLLAENVWFHAE